VFCQQIFQEKAVLGKGFENHLKYDASFFIKHVAWHITKVEASSEEKLESFEVPDIGFVFVVVFGFQFLKEMEHF
jgi:hypothetical protein